MSAIVNTDKLKRRMKELGITQADIAERLELAQPTVSQKLSGVRQFNIEEVKKLAELLDIGKEEVCDYFFG